MSSGAATVGDTASVEYSKEGTSYPLHREIDKFRHVDGVVRLTSTHSDVQTYHNEVASALHNVQCQMNSRAIEQQAMPAHCASVIRKPVYKVNPIANIDVLQNCQTELAHPPAPGHVYQDNKRPQDYDDLRAVSDRD